MTCRKSAMILRKRWELQQIHPSGYRRGAATFTTWLTEHNHRTKLGHRIHAMVGRGVAIIDHRMHVLVVRGVAINDHRVGAGKIMELKGHRIGRRGVDGDIVSQRRSAVCFTARVCNTAVQYTSRHAVCFTARAYSTTVQCLSTGCERIDTVIDACTNMHMYTVFSTPHDCISHDCTTAQSRRAKQLLCTVHSH